MKAVCKYVLAKIWLNLQYIGWNISKQFILTELIVAFDRSNHGCVLFDPAKCTLKKGLSMIQALEEWISS